MLFCAPRDWPALAASGSSPFGEMLRDGNDARSWSVALDLFIASTSALVGEEDQDSTSYQVHQTGRREYSLGVTDFYGQRIYPDGARVVGAFESETGRFKAGARYEDGEAGRTLVRLIETKHSKRDRRCTACGSTDPGCAHYAPQPREHHERAAETLESEAKGQAVAHVTCCPRSRGGAVYPDARAMLLDGLRNVVCGAAFLQLEQPSKDSVYLRLDVIGRHLRKTVRTLVLTAGPNRGYPPLLSRAPYAPLNLL